MKIGFLPQGNDADKMSEKGALRRIFGHVR
jgi:hypothetical protein